MESGNLYMIVNNRYYFGILRFAQDDSQLDRFWGEEVAIRNKVGILRFAQDDSQLDRFWGEEVAIRNKVYILNFYQRIATSSPMLTPSCLVILSEAKDLLFQKYFINNKFLISIRITLMKKDLMQFSFKSKSRIIAMD
jgi:hypothetical protein